MRRPQRRGYFSAKDVSTVSKNGNSPPTLRVPGQILDTFGLNAGDAVHWRIVDDHIEARRIEVILREVRQRTEER